jgi:antitoxin VapB
MKSPRERERIERAKPLVARNLGHHSSYIHGLTYRVATSILKRQLNFEERTSMPRTRVFKSGNSQAVRIPAELAYADTDIDLEITRLGEVITIFPARNSLKEGVAALRRMPKPARVEKRQPIDVPLRQRD